jgi:hypothetical protein
MSFRLLHTAKTYFKNCSQGEYSTDWDSYYLCFMIGIAANRRASATNNNSNVFLSRFIEPYNSAKSVFICLLTHADLIKMGDELKDREAVRQSIEKIIDPDAQTHLSEYAVDLMNEFAAGGYEHINETLPTQPAADPSYFILNWHEMLSSLIENNDSWVQTMEHFSPNNVLSPSRSSSEQFFLDLLHQDENSKLEIKGSFCTNLERYFNGDGALPRDNELNLPVLKTIVGFLNARIKGYVIIGALEPLHFDNLLQQPEYNLFGKYIINGIDLEKDKFFKSSVDAYQSHIIDQIKTRIGETATSLVAFTEVNISDGRSILGITVTPPKSAAWYYLDNAVFFARISNRTESFEGEALDHYKQEHSH